MNKTTLKTIIAVVLLSLVTTMACAQAGVQSPYSRFGLGQIQDRNNNVRLAGMGGTANAISGKGMINLQNPASYAAIDSLSFLFDAGFYVQNSQFSTTTREEDASNASFDYAALAFPITNWCRAAFGLRPYSNMDYSVVVDGNMPFVGDYSTYFEGDGGLNQLVGGLGFRLGKNFAVGANAAYVFGNSLTITTLAFPDSTYSLNTRRSSGIMINSFMFDYGFMYQGKIGELELKAGLTYAQKRNISGSHELFIRSMKGGLEGNVEYIIDTIYYNKEGKATFAMPQGFGVGVSLQKNNRWVVAADFNWDQWENFEIGGVNDSLQNAWRVSLGGEYRPVSTTISSYFTKMTYRMGGFYEQTYLNIYNQSINRFGVTAGVTFPLPKTLSTINLAVEVGQCGTKSDGLIRERYVNFKLAVSVFERWFVKRKYK